MFDYQRVNHSTKTHQTCAPVHPRLGSKHRALGASSKGGNGSMARQCAPLTAMQSMYDWAQHIVQASARCFSFEDPDKHVMWETLVPKYCPSTVQSLETRRENFALALTGQLSVFFCRFLSGHFGSSSVGLLVFVVGNNARCSLQPSELTCYIALACGAGTLDILDLVQQVVAGTIAVHLPFADHLALNLQAFGLLIAPICEFAGSHMAWGCYLTPAMLFEGPEVRSMVMDPRTYPQMMSTYHRQMFHSLPMRMPPGSGGDPMRTRMPPVEAGWGDQVASMIPMAWPGWQDVQAYMPFAGGYQVDALASSSQEQPHGRQRDIPCLNGNGTKCEIFYRKPCFITGGLHEAPQQRGRGLRGVWRNDPGGTRALWHR
eukprot:s211_g22.t1